MEKNWLVRTYTGVILGPVDKEKIGELITKRLLIDEDEICSGNSYWFKIREDDQMARFIWGDEMPGFYPVDKNLRGTNLQAEELPPLPDNHENLILSTDESFSAPELPQAHQGKFDAISSDVNVEEDMQELNGLHRVFKNTFLRKVHPRKVIWAISIAVVCFIIFIFLIDYFHRQQLAKLTPQGPIDTSADNIIMDTATGVPGVRTDDLDAPVDYDSN